MKFTTVEWIIPILCVLNAILYGIDIVSGKYITITLIAIIIGLISIYYSMYVRSSP